MAKMLSTKEFCDLTGVKPNTVHQNMMRNRYPFPIYRNSRFYRFKESDVMDWMANGGKLNPVAGNEQ